MIFKQDLFWNNLPSKSFVKKINSNIGKTITGTFLSKINDPYFIFTGTNNIDFRKITRNAKLLQKLKKRPVSIYLYEPVSYYFAKTDYNLGYYSEFHNDYNFSKDLRAEELDSINKFADKIGKKILVNSCDYRINQFLKEKYPSLDLVCRDMFLRQAACSWMPIHYLDSSTIKKHFWCGNGRYTIHRHMIMCKLAYYDGNYSWFFHSNCSWEIEKNWIEDFLLTDELQKGNDILNSQNFSLDFNTKKVNTIEKDGYYMPDGNFSQPNINYKKTFDDCFVAIVNETRFAQPTGNFSEKVIDAINYGKPFIVVAPPKTLEYIKKIGIKTFSDYWSEEYDDIENHSLRMKKIFDLIDNISKLSITELQKLYDDMIPILEHNRNIIKQLPLDDSIIYDNAN